MKGPPNAHTIIGNVRFKLRETPAKKQEKNRKGKKMTKKINGILQIHSTAVSL